LSVDAAAQREELLRFIEYNIGLAIDHGLVRLRVEDQSPTGESITIDGTKLINFGSCAYLGLNVDRRLKAGAIAAVEKYGPVFSSSAAYTSVDLYTDLEERLRQIFGGRILVPTTTTLGHLSVLPVLVGASDLVLMDHQVHASVQLTAQLVRGFGATVVDVPHNDMAALSAALRESAGRHPKVWYLADGVYSMYGDTAPVPDIVELLDRHPNLHVYFDDAHGVGWKGPNGNGHVLSQTPLHERMIVIGSLAKSWGAGGAVLVLPDGEMAESVLRAGATFSFSGPLHPAELGAAVAAADIHLTPERDARAARLMAQIDYVRDRLVAQQIPVMSLERTPLWYVRAGSPENALELARRMMADGFYVNLAGFPVVPIGMEGFRFTNTIYHTDAHLEAFMDSLTRHLPELYQPLEIYVDLR
jgi:7-keto-8-aminopelargonate synthetase-like enzyme